jgi:putative phage-type endonuclease
VLVNQIKSIPQIQQRTDLWYDHRKKIVTATDVAVILNCNPFQKLNELYRTKCSPEVVEQSHSLALDWGNMYEPVAKKLLRTRNQQVVDLIDLGLGVHPQYDYIGASPDGLVIIQKDDQWELWLLEIKCPYKRQITNKIPYDYWLQIQTQLYVWTDLMKQYNLPLSGCIYCDNYFDREYSSNGIHTYYEQYVLYDEGHYLSCILPEIRHFKQLIDRQQEIERPFKRQKSVFSIEKVFLDYMTTNVIDTQKHYRHFVNNDLLLDWLDLYGDQHGIQRDATSENSKEFSGTLYRDLKTKIENYLITGSKYKCIDISHVDITCDFLEYPQKNMCSLCYEALVQTREHLEKQTPIILNGVLYNPTNKKLGHFDIIIKNKCLKTLFPKAYEKIINATLPYDGNSYTFIQIKYIHLKLCTKNTYVLNGSSGHKEYKMEQIHLHKVLDAYEDVSFSNYSFILGHYASFTSKKTTYDNFNTLDSMGLVSPTTRDKKFVEDMEKYEKFMKLLQTDGSRWVIDPPSRIELYPNMKNKCDYPWSTYKTQLAHKNKELTLLWNIGPKERSNIGGPLRWDQLDVTKLHFNDHYQNIISNMIQSNLNDTMINLSKPRPDVNQIEFYLDFEFVNHISDLSAFPVSRPVKYIYMIGCICVNNVTNTMTYHNYLINRLNKEQEQIMLQNWLQDVINDNQGSHEINIFHWGNAERCQIGSYLNKSLILDEQFNLHMVDLCEMFKIYEVALPNCMSYCLKDVAKSLYEQRLIPTTWTTKIKGDTTIASIMAAEKECQVGHYARLCDVPTMRDIIQYNYVDCETLREIVTYVRLPHQTE